MRKSILLAAIIMLTCCTPMNEVTAQDLSTKMYIILYNGSNICMFYGSNSRAYTLQGTVAQTGHKGIVTQNGKKIIK